MSARLHPILFAVGPILFLYAHNKTEVASTWVLVALAVSLAAALVLWALAWAVLRDIDRAALVVSLVLVEFFLYGHVFDLVWSLLGPESTTVHAVLATLSALVLLAGVAGARSRKIDPLAIGNALSLFSGLLVVFSSVALARATLEEEPAAPEEEKPMPSVVFDDVDSPSKPDIYFIILDGYARADVLKKYYGFDNTPFLDSLRAKGFLVAEHSRSNYFLTFLSLASTLNMRMLDELELGEKGKRKNAYALVRNHLVGRTLHEHGYRVVHFDTNYGGTETSDLADVEYSYRPPLLQNEFISVLMRTTMLRPLEPNVGLAYLYMMDKVQEVPAIEGPTFTFLHLLLPHNPYVFNRDGTFRENIPMTLQWDDRRGLWHDKESYVDQMVYLNGRVEEIVDRILATSPNPPIIVIESDHGSATTRHYTKDDAELREYWRERTSTLNAVYAPPAIVARWGDSPQSVDTFRIILGELFGLELPPIDARILYSTYRDPYNLRDVTAAVVAP